MDKPIVSELLDLSRVPLRDLVDPPPELRDLLDAATRRVVREILDRPDDDGRCC